MDWLTDPWVSGLMRRSFAEAILAGATCGALGCFVLLRGLSFLGESVAHTMVLGIVVAFVAGLPLGLGAAVLASLTVALVGALGRDRRLGPDTAMGVLLPSLFGAGVALAALTEGYRTRLEDALFGSVLGVTTTDVVLVGAVGAATAVALLLVGKELALATFDRVAAQAMGYRLGRLDLLLFGLVTAAVVVGLSAVGNVLVSALLLGPAATSRLVCRTFWPMVALATALGAGAGVAGLYVSWYVEVGAGAAIVLVVGVAFAAAVAATRFPRLLSSPT